MNQRELRIGNIVLLGQDWQIVNGLNEMGGIVHLAGNGIWNDEDHIDPVPVTEEWLIRFGFKQEEYATKDDAYIGWYYGAFKIIETPEGYSVFYECNDYWYSSICQPLQHIHTLQNQFYFSTGMELPINV